MTFTSPYGVVGWKPNQINHGNTRQIDRWVFGRVAVLWFWCGIFYGMGVVELGSFVTL